MPIEPWMQDQDGLAGYMDKTQKHDFIFYDFIKEYRPPGFDNLLLNYPDPEKKWVNWFMMVLRTSQDIFKITDIR